MSLELLMSTVQSSCKVTIQEEELLEMLDYISNEDEFTEEHILCRGVKDDICKEFLRLLEENKIIEVKIRYECEKNGGEIEVAESINQKCKYCGTLLLGDLQHITREIYSVIVPDLTEQIEKYYEKRLERFVDKPYIRHVKQLKGELKRIIPFLGSGISIPLNLPNWTGLIEIFKDELDEAGDSRQFEEYLKQGDVFNALDLLKSVSVTFTDEEQIKTSIKEFIDEKFRSKLDGEYHNIYDILNLNSDFYITTNYDNALSIYKDSFTSLPFVLDDVKDMQDLFKEKRQRIIHLHGNVDRKDTMVVTKTDYERIYSDDKNKSILNGVMASKSLLFIGFSFNDKYINDIYNLLREYIGGTHYIILPDVHRHYGQDLMRKGLKPISIKVDSLDMELTENEYNEAYTQKFVYSLKQIINYLLR
ncbi:hypothetical protein COL10_03465 [Bacillus cereus]|uniref:SIR2 family protein n=1 Tax=Bacillus cereus TaxID=1396 RepID=UPI000BEBDD80|nr:SIR2 family protein [Bacillus cereus]PEF92565.1 hypothetical protein CON46_11365 [Bacillus cereus]PFD76448.1 hypothetical protein CN301_05365 [Bacillus cereus]PFV13688.1 hypothetical protein COL10_03465 [Bacillus cereus]PGV45702.1 hypothetical protein COD74_11010 [Bacillus cereus]